MTRKALVTGGTRGIGKAIASQLESHGMRVITPTRAQLNLADTAGIARFLADQAESFDILVNCAGENFPAPLNEIPSERLQQTMQVNFFSAFQLIQALGPRMAAQGWGRIVNISSVYSSLARPGRAVYSASKAALDALTRTAALEYGPRGVLVNSVSPGFVDTELTRQNNSPEKIQSLASSTAVGRLAAPEEIANIVSFLVSAENSYMTGQNLIVDGGFSIQ